MRALSTMIIGLTPKLKNLRAPSHSCDLETRNDDHLPARHAQAIHSYIQITSQLDEAGRPHQLRIARSIEGDVGQPLLGSLATFH